MNTYCVNPSFYKIAAELLIAAALGTSGCASAINFTRPDRDENGLTLILPGIDSANAMHWQMAAGLDDAGVNTTVKVHDWTTGTPVMGLVHLRYLERNKSQAAELAKTIVRYQDDYPGRPVHLVGHSGGGAMTLLTLEALPKDRQITTATLLSPAISPGYDLRPALAKSKQGIWNYYSYADVPALIAGTTLFGTVDGKYTPSAGAIGFRVPTDASDADRELYKSKLHEVPHDLTMIRDGNLGGHFGVLTRWFARDYIANPIIENHWDGRKSTDVDERFEKLLRD